MSLYNLQSQQIDDCKLVLSLHVGAHFYGLKPGNVLELTFLSPAGEENHWNANNGEYFPADDVRSALEAFDLRAAAGGWAPSGKAKRLEEILERE